MPLLFRTLLLLPLPLIGWLLAHPQRYQLSSSVLPSPLEPFREVLLLPLPLLLFGILVWALPRGRWVWCLLLLPYGAATYGLVQAEGWWTGVGLDVLVWTPWISLLLVRPPQELYEVGRDWLVAHHPQLPPDLAQLAQTLLTNSVWQCRSLVELQSQLEMISSILVRSLPPVFTSPPPFWWFPSLALLLSLALAPSLIELPAFHILDFLASDPASRLVFLMLVYWGGPLVLHPGETIPLLLGEPLFPPTETVPLASALAPQLPPRPPEG